MAGPRLSVVFPVFNAERYLAQSVESLLGQSFGDFEILAVNDGSTDRSLEILEDYARRDDRIRILNQDNRGQVYSMNRAVEEARAEIIARMDADDVAFPDRFQVQVDYLDKHPGVVLLGGRSVVIDAEGNSLDLLEPPTSPSSCAKLLARSNCMCHPSTLFMRHAFEYCGGYREEYAPAEDYDLWLRLMEIGDVANVPDFVLGYRYHADNLSSLRTRKQVLASLSGHLSYHRRAQGLSDVAYGEEETADSVAHDSATDIETVRAYIDRRYRWNIRQAQRLLPEKYARRMFREYIQTMNRRDPDGRIWDLVESWPGRHDGLGERGPYFLVLADYFRLISDAAQTKASKLWTLSQDRSRRQRELDFEFDPALPDESMPRDGFVEKLSVFSQGPYSFVTISGWAPWRFRNFRASMRIHGIPAARIVSSSVRSRPDVVRAFKRKRMLWSGFEVKFIVESKMAVNPGLLRFTTTDLRGQTVCLMLHGQGDKPEVAQELAVSASSPPALQDPASIPEIGENEILCFIRARNERLRIPSVLDYHRSIGVDRFIIIDNDSTDGMGEFLKSQKDVLLFHTDENFGQANLGNNWMHYLLDRFGREHWCLIVDADEYFAYPHSESFGLREFTSYLETRNYEAVSAICVDMYSKLPIERTTHTAGNDLLRTCPYFDPAEMYTYGDRPDQVPSWKAQGGCRKRVFWSAKNLRALTEPHFDEQRYLLDNPDVATAVILGEFRSGWEHYRRYGRKELRLARNMPSPQLAIVPLVKWQTKYRFHTARHKFMGTDQPREAPDRGAILHFKYLSDFTELVNTEVQRGVKWNEATEYRVYQHALEQNPSLTLHYPGSVKYESTESLIREGLVRASREFVRHFALNQPNTGSNGETEIGQPAGSLAPRPRNMDESNGRAETPRSGPATVGR